MEIKSNCIGMEIGSYGCFRDFLEINVQQFHLIWIQITYKSRASITIIDPSSSLYGYMICYFLLHNSHHLSKVGAFV